MEIDAKMRQCVGYKILELRADMLSAVTHARHVDAHRSIYKRSMKVAECRKVDQNDKEDGKFSNTIKKEDRKDNNIINDNQVDEHAADSPTPNITPIAESIKMLKNDNENLQSEKKSAKTWCKYCFPGCGSIRKDTTLKWYKVPIEPKLPKVNRLKQIEKYHVRKNTMFVILDKLGQKNSQFKALRWCSKHAFPEPLK